VADGVFEAALRAPARAFRDSLDERDRAEVDRLIALIELDPYIDNVHKFLFQINDRIVTIYDNGTWRIGYRIVDNWVVEILSIRRIDPDAQLHLRL
jgi:hypothetical protein